MGLDEGRIEQIVEIVVSRLQQQGVDLSAPNALPSQPDNVTDGVFQEMDACIQAASRAQKRLVALPLAVREQIIQAIREVGLTHADEYAQMEFEETGLGKVEDNARKNQAACLR